MLLKEAIDQFEKYTKITKAKGTQQFYEYYLRLLKKELGNKDCDSIDNNVILDYIVRRQDYNPNVLNNTLNKHIITLKAVVRYATGRKIVFSKLREKRSMIGVVPERTYKKIFDYYQKHLSNSYSFRNYLFLKLLLDTGLRLREIIHVQINDIDFETLSIYIRVTKTDVDRHVYFTEQTKMLLLTFLATHKFDRYLFFDFKTGKKLTTSSVECFIYRLKKKLDIKANITPHKWRHTFATNYLRRGGSLEELRILMGHSSLKTTQKYLHLSKNDISSKYHKIMN